MIKLGELYPHEFRINSKRDGIKDAQYKGTLGEDIVALSELSFAKLGEESKGDCKVPGYTNYALLKQDNDLRCWIRIAQLSIHDKSMKITIEDMDEAEVHIAAHMDKATGNITFTLPLYDENDLDREMESLNTQKAA